MQFDLLYYLQNPHLIATLSDESKAILHQAMIKKHWLESSLDYLLRPNSQLQIYNFTKEWKQENPDRVGPLVWNCHRRIGKSYLLVAMCIERCLRYPNQEVRFGAPTATHAKQIVAPLIKMILQDCPDELYPHKSRNQWHFKNPAWGKRRAESIFYLVSCKDEADDQRGMGSDMVVLDECGFIPNLDYVVDSVFIHHFSGREDPLFILSSTPPKTVDHPWVMKYLAAAKRENRYIKLSTEENPDFTDRDKELLLAVLGSEKMTPWKREALCMCISDEESLIIPEFTKTKADVVFTHYERPEYFFPHICIDLGCVDFTAVLFGYVDFKKQQLIIEDEYVEHYKSLGEIAKAIKEKEEQLYGKCIYPVRRFGDNDTLDLTTLRIDYGLPISAADKYGREPAIAELRTAFSEGKVKINSRCEHLIFQLENGLRDEKGKWVRTGTCGHCDAIAALVYLNRMINWHANPYPLHRSMDPQSFYPAARKKIKTGQIRVTHDPLVVLRK